jgi:hypothetical protein
MCSEFASKGGDGETVFLLGPAIFWTALT